jgi:prepilin-type N-terminal cleavage/methylation domain-containing protein
MRRRAGFSLIETMIAVLVLSFIVLVFGAVFPTAASMRYKAENVTRATTLAHQTLEQLRGLGYANLGYSALAAASAIDASPSNGPYAITGVRGLATALPGGAGTLTITDEATDLKRARVDITWSGINSSGSTASFVTFIANKDVLVQ